MCGLKDFCEGVFVQGMLVRHCVLFYRKKYCYPPAYSALEYLRLTKAHEG
eukprot:TRINITY_DN1396_c0_g1_i2.p3 TRINITY_DN1396_c0_g1~~TRINITY_DN1396_c0_g1_i2.p3  ORF type:complete len:50 (-),score=12.40 TRINITY_DN1396_c0_g1_i2:2-151(-)